MEYNHMASIFPSCYKQIFVFYLKSDLVFGVNSCLVAKNVLRLYVVSDSFIISRLFVVTVVMMSMTMASAATLVRRLGVGGPLSFTGGVNIVAL